METTKNKLTPKQNEFFDELRNYLDKPIYFYGSIQRDDYFPKSSDIDIDIFTDNFNSTIYKLQNFLHLSKGDFKKFVYKIKDQVVYGYKCKYKNEDINLKVEMAIFNEKYKNLVLKDHSKDLSLPFYVMIALIILKFLYYNLSIISKEFFQRCKRFIMNDNDELKFISLDI